MTDRTGLSVQNTRALLIQGRVGISNSVVALPLIWLLATHRRSVHCRLSRKDLLPVVSFKCVKMICTLASHTNSFRRNVATNRWGLLQKKARACWSCIRSLGRCCRLPDNAWRLHLDTQRELLVNFADVSIVKCRGSGLISHLFLVAAAVILCCTHVNQIAGSFSPIEHVNCSFTILEQWGASWMAKWTISANGGNCSGVSAEGADCGLWGWMDAGGTSPCLV